MNTKIKKGDPVEIVKVPTDIIENLKGQLNGAVGWEKRNEIKAALSTYQAVETDQVYVVVDIALRINGNHLFRLDTPDGYIFWIPKNNVKKLSEADEMAALTIS